MPAGFIYIYSVRWLNNNQYQYELIDTKQMENEKEHI